jgi:hypothetical protein
LFASFEFLLKDRGQIDPRILISDIARPARVGLQPSLEAYAPLTQHVSANERPGYLDPGNRFELRSLDTALVRIITFH